MLRGGRQIKELGGPTGNKQNTKKQYKEKEAESGRWVHSILIKIQKAGFRQPTLKKLHLSLMQERAKTISRLMGGGARKGKVSVKMWVKLPRTRLGKDLPGKEERPEAR